MKNGMDKNELRKMKNNVRRMLFFSLVLFASISATIYAHPGRTDGSGGHTNHSTGEYHYHHGYDDHQHYDMDGDGIADCPYKFKDNTVHKDSSSSTANYSKDRYNSLMQEEEEKAEEKQEEKNYTASTNDKKGKNKVTAKDVISFILVVIIVFPPVIVVPTAYIFGKVRDLIQKLKKK